MDKIEKFLRQLSSKEREVVESIIRDILSDSTRSLNIKKLRGEEFIFRVRKGGIRVVFFKEEDIIRIVFIGRRNEKTYKFGK